ncbi:MAG: hypothetical protein M3N98_03885 [Actinomycetota bacterium]|nr:hypothetical protein [Actinomycetota bacterium]
MWDSTAMASVVSDPLEALRAKVAGEALDRALASGKAVDRIRPATGG